MDLKYFGIIAVDTKSNIIFHLVQACRKIVEPLKYLKGYRNLCFGRNRHDYINLSLLDLLLSIARSIEATFSFQTFIQTIPWTFGEWIDDSQLRLQIFEKNK